MANCKYMRNEWLSAVVVSSYASSYTCTTYSTTSRCIRSTQETNCTVYAIPCCNSFTKDFSKTNIQGANIGKYCCSKNY